MLDPLFFLPSPLLPWQLPAREIGLVFEYLVKMKYILVSGGEFFLPPSCPFVLFVENFVGEYEY